jgi:hypothetical protein
MKIKLSRAQWESIGLKIGWIKVAKSISDQTIEQTQEDITRLEKIVSYLSEIGKLMDEVRSKEMPMIEASRNVMSTYSIVLKSIKDLKTQISTRVSSKSINKIVTSKDNMSEKDMLETFLKFKNNGRANEMGVTEKDVDPKELAAGIEVEYEHTTDRETAKRIAMDHLAETKNIKSKYYTYLKEMEAKIEKEDNSAQ